MRGSPVDTEIKIFDSCFIEAYAARWHSEITTEAVIYVLNEDDLNWYYSGFEEFFYKRLSQMNPEIHRFCDVLTKNNLVESFIQTGISSRKEAYLPDIISHIKTKFTAGDITPAHLASLNDFKNRTKLPESLESVLLDLCHSAYIECLENIILNNLTSNKPTIKSERTLKNLFRSTEKYALFTGKLIELDWTTSDLKITDRGEKYLSYLLMFLIENKILAKNNKREAADALVEAVASNRSAESIRRYLKRSSENYSYVENKFGFLIEPKETPDKAIKTKTQPPKD